MNQVVVAKQDSRMPHGRTSRTRGLLLASTALVGVAAAMLPLVVSFSTPAVAAGGNGGNNYPQSGAPGAGGADGGAAAGSPGIAGANGAGGGGGGSGVGGGQGGAGSGGAAGGAGATGSVFTAGTPAVAGADGASGEGGGGGGGGSTIAIPSFGLFGTFTGTAGGNGGNGGGNGGGGGGGAGGAGAVITAGSGGVVNITAGSRLTAGAGGAGGASSGGGGGTGGTGGIGLDFLGVGNVTIGAGATLSGGAGGSGGSGATIPLGGSSFLILNGSGGANGAGIRGGNLTITNSGTIQGGGLGNLDGVQVVALQLTGGTNVINYGNATSGLGGDVVIAAGGTIQMNAASGGTTVANTIQGGGSLIQNSANTLTLTGSNFYTGSTTIGTGTLALSGAGSIAFSSGVVNNGTFDIAGTTAGASIRTLSGAGATTLGAQTLTVTNGSTVYSGIASGTGGLTVSGGIQTLSGANDYTGQTTVSSGGTLRIGDGTTAGNAGRIGQNAAGTVFSNVATTGGTLAFNRTDTAGYTYGGVITGSGTVSQIGSGLTTLTGISNGFSGTANVNAGTLSVNGTLGNGAATVNVNNGGTLHGTGTIGGTVVVNTGGTVSAGNSPGTMNVTNYTANGGGTLFELNQPNVVGGASNDLINVSNTLTVNANSPLTLQTTAGGMPASGLYRIFTYGTLSGPLSNFDTTVTGAPAGSAELYTLNNGVNVRVFGAGQITQYWDGLDQTGAAAGAQGASATWNATNTNWVDDPAAGTINDRWRSQAGVFGNGTTNNAAVARTVTVVGAQNFQSLRFSDNNYTLTAGAAGSLNLVGNPFAAAADQTFSAVTVDGGNTASLNLPITGTGNAGLLKLGGGTLNLGGVNTYTGGTRIDTGALVITATGSVASGVTNNAGFTNLGTVNLGVTNTAAGVAGNNGTINGGVVNNGGFGNGGVVNGGVVNNGGFGNGGAVAGGLTNSGTYLQTAGSTNGSTTNTGTVNANGGAFTGAIANDAGAFNVGGAVTADSTFTNSGTATLSVNTGSLTGITLLTNNSTAATGMATAAGTTLSAGGLAGTTATATIANAGTLNLVGGVGDTSYAGRIAGAGIVNKSGAGLLTLAGANATGAQFTGTLNVNQDAVSVNGTFGDTTANAATVNVSGTLGGNGVVAGNVVVNNGGTLSPGVINAGRTPTVATLGVGGSLTLNSGSVSSFDLGTPGVIAGTTNDLVTVGGSLAVNAGATLALRNAQLSGVYQLYRTGGTVTGNFAPANITSTAGTSAVTYLAPVGPGQVPQQVNARVSLVAPNGAVQNVQFWDGTDFAGTTPGGNGGNGTWNATNTNWATDPTTGQINDSWQSQVGVFAGAAGTVTVEGTQNLQGLQFTTDGYLLTPDAAGGSLNLTGNPFAAAALQNYSYFITDEGVTATIATPITGAAGIGLLKAGAGTLTLTGASTYSGQTLISAGTLQVGTTGVISGTSSILNDATFQILVGGSVTTPAVTNNGTLRTAGLLNATTSITNNGTFTQTGGATTTATLSNAQTGTFTQSAMGTLNTNVTENRGIFTSAGAVNATTSFTNFATGTLAASGPVTTPTFTNAGTVNGVLNLFNVSQITNQAGGLIRDGVSVNAAAGGARLDNAGTIGTGGLVINTAAGTLRAFNTSSNTFFGYVSSAAGTTSTFTNTATGRWNYQEIGNLLGTEDTIVNQGLFSVTAAGGTLNGLERFDNRAGGQVLLNASLGGPIGVFDNAGTVGIPATSSFNGSLGSTTFNNLASGTINLQNTPAGSTLGMPNYRVTDTLTLAGNYNGTAGSRVAVDVDLSRSDGGVRGDRLIVAGTDAGSSLLNVNIVNGGRVFFSNPIPVVQAGGGSLQLQIDPTTPLPTTGFIGYTLQQTPGSAGSYQIVSQVASGQAAAPGASISSLITSLNVGFFQSISAFISGPAEHRICTEELRNAKLCDQPASTASVGMTSTGKSWAALNQQAAAAPVAADANTSGILPDTYGFGLWARGSGGETTIRSASSSTSAGITNIGQNKTRIGFAGMQFGGDFAVFNLRNSGFNLHMGVTGGEIYADGRELQSSQAMAVFNVPFVGTYAALTSGAFTSDIAYRHDFYNARISDPTSGVFAQRLPIGSDTVAGSAGYRIDLPGLFGGDQAYFLEPSGSVSYTETRVGTLGVTGGTLSFQPIDSILGRVGVRAGTTFVAGDKLALQPFMTASVWNEFAGNAASRFTASSIATDPSAFVPILTNRIGTFGQVGLGMTGQLLGTDLLGYVRADLRFGDRIDGYSFNGGVRYPF